MKLTLCNLRDTLKDATADKRRRRSPWGHLVIVLYLFEPKVHSLPIGIILLQPFFVQGNNWGSDMSRSGFLISAGSTFNSPDNWVLWLCLLLFYQKSRWSLTSLVKTLDLQCLLSLLFMNCREKSLSFPNYFGSSLSGHIIGLYAHRPFEVSCSHNVCFSQWSVSESGMYHYS